MIGKAFNEHKLMRRVLLFWSMWITTVFILRVTRPEVVTELDAWVATLGGALITMVTTVGAIYINRRTNEDSAS